MSFHIEKRTELMNDIQRSFMFQVYIMNLENVAPLTYSRFNSEADEWAMVRSTSVQVPQISIEELVTRFMGTKQYYPGLKEAGGDVTISIYETEDQFGIQVINEWANTVFNTDPISGGGLIAGHSAGTKRGVANTGVGSYCSDIRIKLFQYNGESLPYDLVLKNCWLKSHPGYQLNFESNDFVKFDVVFKADFWILEKNPS